MNTRKLETFIEDQWLISGLSELEDDWRKQPEILIRTIKDKVEKLITI